MSLIRELTRLQERDGWLSDAGLVALAEETRTPLHRLQSLSTFYTHFRREPPRGVRVEVCRDLSCMLAGGREAVTALRAGLEGRDDVEVVEVSCPGRCDHAPVARIGSRTLRADDSGALRGALETPPVDDEASDAPVPSERFAPADPYPDVAAHYGTARSTADRAPGWLTAELERAGLRGMGGAAFPTARKWRLVAASEATPRVLICNADESEPGTFKDREILRVLPHLVVEGMWLAAQEVGATRGYVFIRHEYEPECVRLEAAIDDARRRGLLGTGASEGGAKFDIEVFVSPGGYILGEETALLECMEDRRGEPRNKPPFPGQSGLHGLPTLINNVETFAHVTAIAARGAGWWQDLGIGDFAGHKFVSVSGDVERPGVHLVPFGTSFRELLSLCGGTRRGRPLIAFAPGGASSPFLDASALDTAIDFAAVAEAGSLLGSGAVTFVAEGHDLLTVGLSVTRFFRNESCGKCVPCRVGSEKAVRLVEAEGALSESLETKLRALHGTLSATSLCGLGQVALAPLLSLAERFPDRLRGR